jgi:uncharacterized protein (DUF2126 family)/transglutaminase-like putative cysteine protease
MSIRVALNHTTEYRYDRLVALSPQVVRLRPAPHCRTPITSYSLRVLPEPHFLNWQQDPYSNYLARCVFPNETRRLRVEVDLVADLAIINPFDFFIESYAEQYPFEYDATLARELAPFLKGEPPGPRLQALIRELRPAKRRTVDHLVEVNRRLQSEVAYIIRMEPGIQACEETLTIRRGSCRDSAWVLVQLLRNLGLAARFVSGYLIQLTPDVKPLDGPAGAATDFTDLHAWTEVYVPGAGWIGLDPTSGLLAGEGHIPLACAAEPITAAPITGSYQWDEDAPGEADKECNVDFSFHMAVRRIIETPRVTKPYTEETWAEIESLGYRIDQKLLDGDVRLTMGGEPTFVSIDDMDGAEWTVAALGVEKRNIGGELIKRLRDRFAPGALLHYGQGKWYPGESLPRWALGCYWRPDGEPVWQDVALIADERVNYGHADPDARRFITALANRLNVNQQDCTPGYEDVWHYLWQERRLPENVDPLQSNLEDPEDRRRLAKVLDQGLASVIGYALPLERRRFSAPRWVSGSWSFRRERMYLIPGDSPMGFRLPLESLPLASPDTAEAYYQVDPFAPRDALPARSRAQRSVSTGDAGLNRPEISQQTLSNQRLSSGQRSPSNVIRTALCVEPRDGRLYIFMPPQRSLEDYLDLVTAIEDTAQLLSTPVVIEGYSPPSDHRLCHIKVTPDPGVIEVNIHPAASWKELVHNTTTLYEEARQSRLGTEKFMLDGRHTGTGGGNHVIIGGATPADSPVLRRPDLLASLIGYWHNHPSLSFLFSSMFVGPTSQSPRIDEARNDSLYELEIAFQRIHRPGERDGSAAGQGSAGSSEYCPPWLVDRIFRHLLADMTGNTHRAEFCIDKLYSPDSSSGRLGLVEMRAFEMPPHPRMSLVQQLLLRALIAQFWAEPYTQKMARWGTELHDRFMLPHFVQQDFDDVLFDLKRAGLPLQAGWFAPHFEFRFPPIGSACQRGIELDLRQAIEPWHVLGEEPGGGGTVRNVDSSVERLQVRVNGMTDTRHVITCNGRRVPLHPTGTNGEFVAGVRYRAWQPPSCLHPTIGVHTPLVFDVVDTWSNRSIGGCTYHVSHPGGRAYETFPVNAYEAECRRAARFFAFGHTPGPMATPTDERTAELPLTLDLRREPPAARPAGPDAK